MALKERLNDDLKAAMLSGDRFVADTLRSLKAAILDEEVKQSKRDEGLADDEIEKVVAREVKKRQESIKIYRDNGRDDLADPEKREVDVLQAYLPEQLSDDDIRTLVQRVITETGASGPQAMGQVIGAVKAEAGSAADGATVARIAKEELLK